MNCIASFFKHPYDFTVWSKSRRISIFFVSCWARVPVRSAESFSPDCSRNLVQATCWPAQARCRAKGRQQRSMLRTCTAFRTHWIIQLCRACSYLECECVCLFICHSACGEGGQRAPCRSWLSFTIWILRDETQITRLGYKSSHPLSHLAWYPVIQILHFHNLPMMAYIGSQFKPNLGEKISKENKPARCAGTHL